MIRFTRCMVCILSIGALALTGCQSWAGFQRSTVTLNYPHAHGETLVESPHEHYQRARAISAHDSRALVEDLDLLFMTERPTRLTRWHDK